MPTKKEKPKTSPSQVAASVKYNETHVVQIKFNFNKVSDADIIEKLQSLPNKQGYVKSLIRKDMENEKK